MRIILVIACAAAFIFSAWSNMPTAADARQSADATMSPLTMMTGVTGLSDQQFDAY